MFILKNLRFDNIEMTVSQNATIAATIKEAIAIAKTYGCLVTFTFEHSRIVIDASASATQVLSDFYRNDGKPITNVTTI